MVLSCKEIVMGNHSSIGPMDPQIMNTPAQCKLELLELAGDNVERDRNTAMVAHYPKVLATADHIRRSWH